MPTPRSMRELRAEVERLQRRVAELEAGREHRAPGQQALRQSQSLAEAVLASASQGIVVIAGDGRIELANPRAEELFGYAPGALVGQPLGGLLRERVSR